MKILICTSYNRTDAGLVLRSNWTEDFSAEALEKWGIEYDPYTDSSNVSGIYSGNMDLDDVILHVRIITL